MAAVWKLHIYKWLMQLMMLQLCATVGNPECLLLAAVALTEVDLAGTAWGSVHLDSLRHNTKGRVGTSCVGPQT